MAVYVSAVIKPGEASCKTVGRMKPENGAYWMVVDDESYQGLSEELFGEREGTRCCVNLFGEHYKFSLNGEAILRAPPNRLNEHLNISNVIVRNIATALNDAQRIEGYAPAYYRYDVIRIAFVCSMDIVGNVVLVDLLAVALKSTLLYYTKGDMKGAVKKECFKYLWGLPETLSLQRSCTLARHPFTVNKMLLIVKAAETVVKSCYIVSVIKTEVW